MVVVHLRASNSFGGAEQQLLGLALSVPARFPNAFVLFREGGRYHAFWDQLLEHRLPAVLLDNDWPRLWSTVSELTEHLRRLRATVLCCHGYKADLLGWLAARRAGVPV